MARLLFYAILLVPIVLTSTYNKPYYIKPRKALIFQWFLCFFYKHHLRLRYCPAAKQPRKQLLIIYLPEQVNRYIPPGGLVAALRGDYNDHWMAKSIDDSIDFAAKRQVWQRMIL